MRYICVCKKVLKSWRAINGLYNLKVSKKWKVDYAK